MVSLSKNSGRFTGGGEWRGLVERKGIVEGAKRARVRLVEDDLKLVRDVQVGFVRRREIKSIVRAKCPIHTESALKLRIELTVAA